MDEKVLFFIDSLKRNLEGLPEEEIWDAVNYYEEYLYDAIEAGKDPETVLSQLGSPEKLAGMIRAEASIKRAQKSPGLKNYTGVLRSAALGVTTPLAVLSVSLFVFISYCVVVTLFAAAFVTLAAAAVAALGMIYEATTIPSAYLMEIIGTIGIGLFGAGVLLLPAYGLYKLGMLLIVMSSRFIGRMLKRTGNQADAAGRGAAARRLKPVKVIYACLILIAAGLVLSGISGLPVKYFTLFNSMKPDNINIRTAEYDPSQISKISLVTANSHINLTSNPGSKITVTYEQPDYLDYELSVSGSMLSFYEKPNGKLPLYDLAKIHESRTDLTISLPDGYEPGTTVLESTGGFINVDRPTDNLQIKTSTGKIDLNFNKHADSYNIDASTESGTIVVDGTEAGQQSKEGQQYYSGSGTGKTVKVQSSRGNIYISR